MSGFGYPGFSPGTPGIDPSNNSGYGSYWSGPGRSVFGFGSQYSVPLDPRSVQWDPTTGMPMIPGPVPGKWALAYQQYAQMLTRQRQQALWSDAQGALQQGLDLFQSYRPGGSAALASGIFGQRASLYAQQASALTEPDLLSGYRQRAIETAQEQARKFRDISTVLGAVQSVANVVGAITGAGQAPNPIMAAAPPETPAPSTPYPGGFTAAGTPGGSYSSAPSGGLARLAAPPSGQAGGPGMIPQAPPGQLAAGLGPPGGGGGGAGGGAGLARAPAPGGRGGPSGPQAGGGGAMPQLGDLGVDGDFSSRAVAASAARANPIVGGVAQMDYAQSPLRQSSTAAIVMSARSRLLQATFSTPSGSGGMAA